MSGLDPVLGFVKRDAADLLAQLEADEVAGISPGLDVSSSSPVGQINGAELKLLVELWDLAQAVEASSDPDRATGAGLDGVAGITGTTREPATRTQVEVNLTMAAAATIPAGSLMAILLSPSVQFVLVGPEPPTGVPVAPGDIVSVGAGVYAARFQAVNTGAIPVNAGTLTSIVTPITGWVSGTNPLDGVTGHAIESDSALRLRREAELSAAGSTPVDALRAELYRLLAASNVTGFVDVQENVLDVPDGDGRDPHSIEVLIDDSVAPLDDDAIGQVIWDGKAGGIATFGSAGPPAYSGTALDTLGRPRVMNFTRPTMQEIWFVLTVVIDPVLFPGDGVQLIQDAMVAYGNTLAPGDDVMRTAFFGPIFSVPGVVNVTVLHLGMSDPATLDADIPMGIRERATFDTSRIDVTVI